MVNNLSDALLIDPRNKRITKALHYLLGTIYHKLQLFLPAIESFTNYIDLDETNYNVFFWRAKCYLATAHYVDAIIDLMEVKKFPISVEVNGEIAAMRRKIGQNFRIQTDYDILEVDRDATAEANEASFQSFELVHKNNIANAKTESEKRKHDFKFKKIQCAHRILADNDLREIYDIILETQDTIIECLPVQSCCDGCGNFSTRLRDGLASCTARSWAGISIFFYKLYRLLHFCFFSCIYHSCSCFQRCLERYCLNTSFALGVARLLLLGIVAGILCLIYYFVRFLWEFIHSFF